MAELFSAPFVVVDTETTGIPGKVPGWTPRLVEVGACIVGTDGQVSAPWSALVRPPGDHLRDLRAQGALAVNGLSVAQIEREGSPEVLVACRFWSWLRRTRHQDGVACVRAFNSGFDRWFLEGRQWSAALGHLPWGACVMREAQAVMGPAGALARRPERGEEAGADPWRYPRLLAAVEFFSRRGHAMPQGGAAHRAGPDASAAAHVAVAMARERAQAAADGRPWVEVA